MKIGIVTHKLYHNYGGILQAYALQEVLRKLGHNPITIDYFPNRISNLHYILSQIKTIFYFLTFRTSRKFYSNPNRRNPKFQNFMDKNMKMTHRVKEYTLSILIQNKIEVIVVGSDQVWRGAYHSPSLLKDMYLNFAKDYHIPKIAYAASFGTERWEYSEELTKECSQLVKSFKAISTREDSGVYLCKKYLEVEAIAVSDPTLLLDKNDYARLCRDIPIRTNKKYLLTYLLDADDEQKDFIANFARTNNLDLIFCTSEKNIEYSVEEWLALYRDASFVITNSFHGTVFSIINNIDFYSVSHIDRGRDRFVSLLSRFGLSDRLKDNFLQIPNVLQPIDWEKVNNFRNYWKEKSLNFLVENLK